MRLAQRLEALGKLAGGVAHDFNNVLQVVQACADNLLTNLPSHTNEHRDALQVAQASERAAGLTARLLSLARERPEQPTTFELNAAVARTVDMLRRIIGEDIAIETILASDAGAIAADRGQFEHVLLNLGVNARDSMPGGGRIHIATASAERDGRPFVRLDVRDTGSGMDAATQRRIFEPFFTTKRDGHGTGLGLTMVKSFIQRAGGHIEVESQLGAGTRFRMWLPCVGAVAPASAPRVARLRGHGSIQVVEDEGSVRRVIAAFLRDGGYDVLEASSGREALAVLACAPTRPSLVLTDLVMPEMGGVELSRELARLYGELPIVFMTGYAPDGFVASHRRVLRKPFPREELERTLREELELAKAPSRA